MALRQFFCVVATCAISCISGPLFAVSALQPSTSPGPEQRPDKREVGGARTGQDELDLIVVTARRREEPLQQIPISVVSLSGKQLEDRSINHLRGLQNFVPNLTFAPSQNVGEAASNIFIRGIGQEDFLAGNEPGVGFYLDGIYVARSMGTLMDLLDISRVEVLRGPQGTLYGKNTVGGAINIISVKPGPEPGANARLILGNIDRFDLSGMVNAPLSKTLFVRLSAGRTHREGYLERIAPPFEPTSITEVDHRDEGSERSLAGRLQLQWLASPTLTIEVAADASRQRNTQSAVHVDAINPNAGILPAVNELIRAGRLPGPEITDELVTDDLLESYAGGSNLISRDVQGLAATFTKDMGSASIKLIASHRRLRSHVSTDLDGTWFTILGSDFRERHRQSSVELQASGFLGSLSYTAGLFGIRERTQTSSGRGVGRLDVLYLCGCFYPPDNLPVLFFPRRELSGGSYAGYLQGSYRIRDKISATLGGRLSRDWKRMDAQLVELDAETFESTDVVLRRGDNRGQWTSFTWRAGLEYQAMPDLMLYASAAKGYKSGGFNGRPVVNLPNLGLNEYDPEHAITYEFGIRSEWFSRRTRLNATLFHSSYRDIQLRQQAFVGGILTTLVQNAARARVRGLEIEAVAKLGDRLSVNLAYGFLDPKYLNVGRVPNLTLETEFQRTPRHSFTATLGYEQPWGPNRLGLHGDFGYRSHEQFQLLPSRFDQNGYGLVGMRLALRGPGDRWSAALFGTNLTDTRYRTAGRGTGLQDVGFANSIIGPPRQVGIDLRAGF